MPSPRTMYGGYGALKMVVRVEPPGNEAVARSNSAAEPRVRARYSLTSADVTCGSSARRVPLSRLGCHASAFPGAHADGEETGWSAPVGRRPAAHRDQLGLRQLPQPELRVVRGDDQRPRLLRGVFDEWLPAL